MAVAFPCVRQVSLEVCGSEQSSDLVPMNTFTTAGGTVVFYSHFNLLVCCQTVQISSHKGLWTLWSALSVLSVATEMLFDVPRALQSQVLRCLSALPSRPPCYTLNKLFSFCLSSLFLCWQFLITDPLRRNAHHLPRFALESVLVNCRASAAALSFLRRRLRQDRLYESCV